MAVDLSSTQWVRFDPQDESTWPPIKVRVFAKVFSIDVEVIELVGVDRAYLGQLLKEGDEIVARQDD